MHSPLLRKCPATNYRFDPEPAFVIHRYINYIHHLPDDDVKLSEIFRFIEMLNMYRIEYMPELTEFINIAQVALIMNGSKSDSLPHTKTFDGYTVGRHAIIKYEDNTTEQDEGIKILKESPYDTVKQRLIDAFNKTFADPLSSDDLINRMCKAGFIRLPSRLSIAISNQKQMVQELQSYPDD